MKHSWQISKSYLVHLHLIDLQNRTYAAIHRKLQSKNEKLDTLILLNGEQAMVYLESLAFVFFF